MAKIFKHIKYGSRQKTKVMPSGVVCDKLKASYNKDQQKLKIMSAIHQDLVEVRLAGKTGQPLQTLNDFLNEKS